MKKIIVISILAIILLSVSFTSISAQSKYDIPSWIKGVAGFWSEGKITDEDFGDALSFLIDNDIITIPKIKQLQDENTRLQSENTKLKTENTKFGFDIAPKKITSVIEPSTSVTVKGSEFSGVTCHRDSSSYVMIDGKFTNNDDKYYAEIHIQGALLDESGNVLATSMDIRRIQSIEPHQTKLFNVPINFEGDYASCHVELNYKE